MGARTSTDPAFRELQDRLPELWRSIDEVPSFEHTSVVVPSLSVDQRELAKIEGASFYEERLLFTVMRLRHPGARVVYVTSQPVHPDIVEYYLQLLHGVPASFARRRLIQQCVWDASAKPLTDKILERPHLLERLRRFVGTPERAYLTCFNTTDRERELAVRLGIPLNGVDPDLLDLGGKSGSRRVFIEAGVDLPAGREHVRSREDVVDALVELSERRPAPRRAVLKLDHSFAGEGNATFTFPEDRPTGARCAERIDAALSRTEFAGQAETLDGFLEKLSAMGGIVEEFVDAEESRSPSAQMRIVPTGEIQVVSTHDQILGGPTMQAYYGCRFPASLEYRGTIASAATRIGEVLRDRGVIGRYAVDFVVTRGNGAAGESDDAWTCHAIEINLRMGGTTPPFMALQFLTGGRRGEDGVFRAPGGTAKFYRATDHLKSPHYRGLLPEDLIEQSIRHGIGYDAATQKGVLFHMIGALSQYGKLGVTCIGDSPDESDSLFERTVVMLDHVAGAPGRGRRIAPFLDSQRVEME